MCRSSGRAVEQRHVRRNGDGADKRGATETLTIVGVEELDFERDAISWISPLGKALLAADMGDTIKLQDGRSAKIVKIES